MIRISKTALREYCNAVFEKFAYSKTTYKRNVLNRRRNASRKTASHCSNGVAAKSIARFVIQSEAWESHK